MVIKLTQSQSVTHHPTPPLSVGPFLVAQPLVPAIVLNHVGQLDDELALFILLAALKGVFLQCTAQDSERSYFRWKKKDIVCIFDRIKQDIHSEQITNSDLKTLPMKKDYHKYIYTFLCIPVNTTAKS